MKPVFVNIDGILDLLTRDGLAIKTQTKYYCCCAGKLQVAARKLVVGVIDSSSLVIRKTRYSFDISVSDLFSYYHMNRMFLKVFKPSIIRRFYLERMGEPFIYNFVSLWVALFGSFQRKIDYDLVPRQPYAFGVLEAFKQAKELGLKKIILVEFGVAAGGGFFNLIYVANKLKKDFDIDFDVVGFDTGKGMPPPVDFRDHPEKYGHGDFPMDVSKVKSRLPGNAKLYLGEIKQTVEQFLDDYAHSGAVIGFVSIDVDYYSSTVDCLTLFKGKASFYIPRCVVYLDDVNNVDHNVYCGELLAIEEFNQNYSTLRKFARMNQLRNWRIFKDALWLDQMYFYHVFDHETRTPGYFVRAHATLDNPYL